MKPTVLLIFVGQYASGSRYHHYVSPLGIANVSAYLNQNNVFAKQVDLRLLSGFSELKKILLHYHPDIIGFSQLTTEADLLEPLIIYIKKVLPKSHLIVGGPHASVLPSETASIPGVEAAVYGEGELTALDLIQTIRSRKSIKNVLGIAYKNKLGKVITNPPRPFIKDLDALPYPDRELLSSGNYISESYDLFFPMKYPYANIFVSRGCPGMCTMCQPTIDKLFGRPFRFRSAKNVVEEIKILINKYQVKSIIFWDDTLTANRKWMDDFGNIVVSENLKFDWWCYSRVNYVNPDILAKVKKCGCKMICFGIESGSDRILKVINKGSTAQLNQQAINYCHQFGILANANMMIGMPTETLVDVQMSDRLLRQTRPDIVWASVLSPLPGTYLGDAYLRSDEFQVSSTHYNWNELIRAQTGKAKIKDTIDIKYIIKYQSKWHSTRFNPILLSKSYYLKACYNRLICHVHSRKYNRIFSEFLLGPLIESGRHMYWLAYYIWNYVLINRKTESFTQPFGEKRSKVLG